MHFFYHPKKGMRYRYLSFSILVINITHMNNNWAMLFYQEKLGGIDL